MNWLALGLAVLSCMTFAQDSPRDFAYAVPLELSAPGAFYEVELPQVVYEAVLRDDLGDVRVLNAAGEIVPHAFVPQLARQARLSFLSPVLFPLQGNAGDSPEQSALQVDVRADGTIVSISQNSGARRTGTQRLVGYVADLSAHKGMLRAVEIDPLPSATSFAATLTIEGSNDLARWWVLASKVPVLRLESGGQRLERLRAEFPPQEARYLRLSWSSKGDGIELSSVKVESGTGVVESERNWKSLSASSSDREPNLYRFDTGGRFPADRLRVALPETNTVAAVEILTRAAPSETWRRIAYSTVYRLKEGGEEIESPIVALGAPAQRELLLRVDPKGGGIGSALPTVKIGWVAQRLVFVARGEGPYRLAYGSRRAMPSAYPIESLVPGYGAEGEAGGNARRAIKLGRAGEPVVLAGAAATEEQVDVRRVMLWGTLVLSVACLGAMSWRLWRGVDEAAGSDQLRGGRSNS